jgi:methylenetetrahydrofolate dehydrogenase (NADP+)/methenyltetrahydrofolate cyclohydrolase
MSEPPHHAQSSIHAAPVDRLGDDELAHRIDGHEVAAGVRADVKRRVEALRERGHEVRLDAVIVTDDKDSASGVYVKNQRRACETLGITYRLHEMPGAASEDDIAGRVLLLNNNPDVHAVMVHMPLPDGIDTYRIQSLIDPSKDIEGVNPANIGNIVYGRSSLAPCTALAVMKMIETTGLDLRGKRTLVVGASDIVGKPIAVMLMRPEATVLSTNKHTEDLPTLARTADVLIAAAGVPKLVDAAWVKPGAVVIDVGIHRIEVDGRADGVKRVTVGDVEPESVRPVAGWLSPVPGGVGPVTVAMLLHNVVAAAERQFGV